MSGKWFWLGGLVIAAAAAWIALHEAEWARPWALGAEAGTRRGPEAKTAGGPSAADPFGSVPGPEGGARAVVKKTAPRRAEGGARPAAVPTPHAAEAAILAALDQPTKLDFTETPLADVVAYLKDYHKLNIAFDQRALDDVGIGTDQPITRNLQGVTLRSALDLLLRDLDLTWTIRSEVLLLTSRDAAQAMLITKVYDVADLVRVKDEKGQPFDDYDSLIDTITSTVAATDWDEVGGPGSIVGQTFGSARVLVVAQTYQHHEEVARLLKEIRAVSPRPRGDEEVPVRPRPKPKSGAAMGMGMMGSGGMGGMMPGMGGMPGGGVGGMPGMPGMSPKPAPHAKHPPAHPKAM